MIWHLILKPIWRVISGWWCDPYRTPLRHRWTIWHYHHQRALSRAIVTVCTLIIIGGLIAIGMMLR